MNKKKMKMRWTKKAKIKEEEWQKEEGEDGEDEEVGG